MLTIEKKIYNEERSLYGIKDVLIKDCSFISSIGESPLKECQRISVQNSFFSIRYPFWHNRQLSVKDTQLDELSRAPFWYCEDILLDNLVIASVKALRESKKIDIQNSSIKSSEFGWKSSQIKVQNSKIEGEYLFLESHNIDISNMQLIGKYSLQYVKDVTIQDSHLDTKDAFWHSTNVTVMNSTINGEYLGWYSKNLHLINCHIKGTQPLCYAENCILTNCTLDDCDLAFEYSTINVTTPSVIESIKNPLKGTIDALDIKEIIFDDFKRNQDNDVIIIKRGKQK